MRNAMLASFIIVVMLLTTSVALAQDIPPGDPKDNVCYDGGIWDDGKCNIPPHVGSTELAWQCGWYMARLLDGRLPTSAMPLQCQHTLTAAQNLATTGPVCVLAAPEEPRKVEVKKAGLNLWCRFEDGTVTVDFGNDGNVDDIFTFQSSDSGDDCAASVTYLGVSYLYWDVGETSWLSSTIDTSGLEPYYCRYFLW